MQSLHVLFRITELKLRLPAFGLQAAPLEIMTPWSITRQHGSSTGEIFIVSAAIFMYQHENLLPWTILTGVVLVYQLNKWKTKKISGLTLSLWRHELISTAIYGTIFRHLLAMPIYASSYKNEHSKMITLVGDEAKERNSGRNKYFEEKCENIRFPFLYVEKKAEGQREVGGVAELQALCSGDHHITRILLPFLQLNHAACFSGRKRETSTRKCAYDNDKEE